MSANRLQIFFLRKMLSRKRKRARVAPPWLGKRELIRHNGKDVEVFLCFPKQTERSGLPVMFNLHGGAWVGGDATCIDWQSDRIAEMLSGG